MPEKKQYDDQLVELLGRGELSDRQIAKRLGLSFSHVSCIARGEIRSDLQPKINAAMRRTLKQAWKNGGRLASDSGQPLPPNMPKAPFDRFLAVELIASGQLTLPQIASRLGVHTTTVSRIVAGRSHPELQPLIREAQRRYRDRARRIGSKWSAQIVTKQIQVGLKDNGWVGLRARQDLLDRFLGPEDDAKPPPSILDLPSVTDLPEPLKTEVIRALGGPVDEDEETGDWLRRPAGPQVPVPISGAAPATAAQEDAAAPQKNDVASRSRCPSGSGPSAESPQNVAHPPSGESPQNVAHPPSGESPQNVAQPPSAEQEQKNDVAGTNSPTAGGPDVHRDSTEEGCSRSKKRRRRKRRQVDSFIR